MAQTQLAATQRAFYVALLNRSTRGVVAKLSITEHEALNATREELKSKFASVIDLSAEGHFHTVEVHVSTGAC